MGWHIPENLRLKRNGKEYCIFGINIVDITCYGEKIEIKFMENGKKM